MSIGLRRRELIAALGGAAAWPLAARAQQGDRVRRIGVLMPFDENDPESKRRLSALTQTLAGLGWTDGRNVRIDLRWAGGDSNRIRAFAVLPYPHRFCFAPTRSSNNCWLCRFMALNDFRCSAQNSVGIGAISDIKAGLRRTEIRCL